jgi:hypothetical protein
MKTSIMVEFVNTPHAFSRKKLDAKYIIYGVKSMQDRGVLKPL